MHPVGSTAGGQNKVAGLTLVDFVVIDPVEFSGCSVKGRVAMVRLARSAVFDFAEVISAHVFNRTVR